MSSFYANLATVATELLTTYGQTVTFSRDSASVFDPVEGKQGAVTTTTWTGKGAAFDYNRSEVDGTTIKADDIRLVIESVAAPSQGDTATVDSVVYRVMNVSPSSPAGTVTHYTVQLRR